MSLNNIRSASEGSACPAGMEASGSLLPAIQPSPEMIIDSISDVVEVIDQRGVITYNNLSTTYMDKLGLDSVLGRPCRLAYDKLCPTCEDCPLDEVFSSGQSITTESSINLKDGQCMWIRQHLYPMADANGRVSGVLRLVFDITREKRQQDKEAKYLDSLEQSLYNRSQSQPPPLAQDLSAREREVLSYLADGMSNQEIARLLGISPHTVKTHVVHIFNKLGVKDRTQAAVTATRLELF